MGIIFCVLGIAFIVSGMNFGSGTPLLFFDSSSLMIVVGVGSCFTFAHHSFAKTVRAFSVAIKGEKLSALEGRQHIRVLSSARVLASASGVLGALIGLVNMLSNMDDPAAIGPAMALALLATLYGVMIAELWIGPLINRLRTCMENDDSPEKPLAVTAITFAALPMALLSLFVMISTFSP